MGPTWWRRFARVAVLAALLVPLEAGPARAAPAPVELPGHVPVQAISGAQDLGALAGTTPLTISVALAAQQPALLANLLRDQYTPASGRYHQFLTTAQFAAQFGATKAQLAAVAAFLRGQGLTVQSVAPDRLFVDVAGSATQVERAFGVALHQYRASSGATFVAPTGNPHVPAALAGVVSAVHGLTTLPAATPRLDRRGGRPAVPPGPDGRISRPSPTAAPVAPRATASPVGLTPAGIRTAYDLTPAYAAGIDGGGQALGLFELDGYTPSDVAAYEQEFGLRAVPLQNVLVDGVTGTAGLNADEVTLDIELQVALAPGASQLRVYEGPNTDQGVVDTYARIANDDLATSISTSWGICEPNQLGSTAQSEAVIFQQMASQGQTIFAAAGDRGAYDCGTAQLAVDDPASDPWMTGVGGTHLDLGSGGAYDAETTWDDQCASGPCAGGGGLSQVWAQPPWQTGPGVQNQFSDGKREVPDVALDADPATGYAIYYAGGWQEFGGTSAAAPLWAGWSALSNQYAASRGLSRLGFAAPSLYQVASDAQQYPVDFHDVTQGTNEYYPVTPAYDLATGWGSFDGWNLLRALNGAAPTTPAVTAVSPTSGPPSGGTTVTISGVNFAGATAVTFGTKPAASFTVASPDSVTAVTPAEPQGVVDVTVTTPSGTSGVSSADRFAFISGGPTTSQAVTYQINPSHTGATQFGAFLPTLLRQWSVNLDGLVSYPLIANGRVYVTTSQSGSYGTQLYALDETTGRTAWEVPIGGNFGWSNAAYDAGRVFVVNYDGLLQALDAGSGVSIWSTQLTQYAFSSPPTAVGGVVYVGGAGGGGTLYAVSESTGALLWTASVENGDDSSPAVTSDGIYVSYAGPQVYRFNPSTGALQWHYDSGTEGGGGRTPVYDASRLYVRDWASSPKIFDARTGAILGGFAAGPAPAFVGNVRLALNGGTLEATDLTTGVLLWSFGGDGQLTTAPIVINGTVFVGSGSGALYGIDATTGRQVWTTNVGAAINRPDEQNVSQPLTGLGAGEGLLVVPAGSTLVAYASTPGADVGGHDAQLTATASGHPTLSWDAGSMQTGYVVGRWSNSGTVLLPPGSTLPASATSYTDTSSLTDPAYCYTAVALNGASMLGLSDVLCYGPNSRSATGAPPTISVRLDQTDTTTLQWTSPGGQDGYTLIAIPLVSGATWRQVGLVGTATTATDNTGGTPTCYVLEPTRGTTVLGNSDVLCVNPGQSTLPFVNRRATAAGQPATPLTPAYVTASLAAAGRQLSSGTVRAIVEHVRQAHQAPAHATSGRS